MKVKELVEEILPIKSSVEKLLRGTEKIADDLEKENIKVESRALNQLSRIREEL